MTLRALISKIHCTLSGNEKCAETISMNVLNTDLVENAAHSLDKIHKFEKSSTETTMISKQDQASGLVQFQNTCYL